MRFEFAHEKLHRLAFQPRAPPGLNFQNVARTRAKRAVIQMGRFGIEQPELRVRYGFSQGDVSSVHARSDRIIVGKHLYVFQFHINLLAGPGL